MSSYVPAWVKRDQARFPRSQLPDGRGMEILSPFSAANRDADARAFAALMSHLRTVDARQRTVIMVQVENEIGMIPHARDYSAIANQLIAGEVPGALMSYLAEHRGKLAPDSRSAGAPTGTRAGHVGAGVRHAGRRRRSCSWRGTSRPTSKQSRAPASALIRCPCSSMPRWCGRVASRANIRAPDRCRISSTCGGPARRRSISSRRTSTFRTSSSGRVRTRVPGNPLFIPETGRAPDATPANGLYAIGELDAIGFSPFAIESYKADDALGNAYDVLRQLAPLVLEHQGDDSMIGVRPPVSFDGVVDDTPQSFRLGDYTLHVAFKGTSPEPAPQRKVEAHGGLIIRLGADEYLVAGQGTDRHVLDRRRDRRHREHLGRNVRRRSLGARSTAQRRREPSGPPPADSRRQVRHPARPTVPLPVKRD